ncbi:HesA/MoeB/ThiF family protein [Pseudotabrizicola sp. L79]|uniref:HesA/MoeB/ThiF family protein n=1 Tax=Pseudotabrizicola sp. L79 TaxID=3118402 RepID=UPI002F9311B7
MILVLVMAAAIWGLGVVMKTPLRLRLGMIFGLWLAVVLAQLALPAGNGLREATGGDVRPWLALGVVAGLGFGYRALIARLRNRAKAGEAAVPKAPKGTFRPAELDRYARHIILREIGGPGQKRLKAARVLVVGAGGLGSPALLYLAASGVGVIGVVDADVVDNSNLQRQVIHVDDRIGMPKVFSAEMQMRALNPFIELRPYHRRLDEDSAEALIAEYDLVLDGTDNFETRYLVNRVCARLGKPLISAAITQWEGQMSLYDPAQGGPCYECVFPVRPAPGMVPTCAEAGVAAPLPGVIGAMMAMEAVKELTGAGLGLRGRLMIHDALYSETRMIAVKPRPDCPICAARRAVA